MRKYEIDEHTNASTSRKGIDANMFAKMNLLTPVCLCAIS